MSTEANRRIVKAFVADPIATALAEDVVVQDYAQGRIFRGRREVEALLQAFFGKGFPNAQMAVRAIVAEDAAVVLEFTFQGRQDGPFMGLPPTGREVTVPMTIVFQLVEGHIRSANIYYDAGTLLRQLGLALAVGAI